MHCTMLSLTVIQNCIHVLTNVLYFLDDSMVHLAGIFHNIYLKLEETQEDHYDRDNGWKILIHDVHEIPILATTTHGTSLYLGQGRDLRLDMKKVTH